MLGTSLSIDQGKGEMDGGMLTRNDTFVLFQSIMSNTFSSSLGQGDVTCYCKMSQGKYMM